MNRDKLLLEYENDRLVNGEEVVLTLLDDHHEHVLSHRDTLAQNLNDSEVTNRFLEHIQEHIDALLYVDENLRIRNV